MKYHELKRLAEAATLGPWLLRGKQSIRGSAGEYIAKSNWNNGIENASFIAAANPAVVLALIAENERLRRERTDWQAECLKRGFTYCREPDDHYVLADVPEMAALLGELLGVEVRDRENDSYGETVSALENQVDAGIDAFHRAYQAETERDQLKAEVEALRKALAESERTALINYDCVEMISEHLVAGDLLLIGEESGRLSAAQNVVDSVKSIQKDAERYRWLSSRPRWASVRVDFDKGGVYRQHRVCWFAGDDWPQVDGQSMNEAIDAAMSKEAGQ